MRAVFAERLLPLSGHYGVALDSSDRRIARCGRAGLRQPVFRVSEDSLNDETLDEEDFGGRPDLDVFRHPDPVINAHLLHLDLRTAQQAHEEQPHRERREHMAVNLDPPQILFVDPKSALHFGEHLAVLALSLIARVRCRSKYIGGPAGDYLFAHQMEVEGLRYLPDERRDLFLLLSDSLGPLLRRFALQRI